jgi:hypothetical protein
MTVDTLNVKPGLDGRLAVEQMVGAPDGERPAANDGLMTATLAAGWRRNFMDQTGVR